MEKVYTKTQTVTARPMKEGEYVAEFTQPSNKDGYIITTKEGNYMWQPKEYFERNYEENGSTKFTVNNGG